MMVISAYKTDSGREREHNEDYMWVNEQAGVYIVADGIGGQEAGETASRLAATTAGQFIVAGLEANRGRISTATGKELMTGAIEAANEKVLLAAKEMKQKRRMGTAIVVALMRPPKAYISHAGDARAYLMRDSTLIRLTEDDSWVTWLVTTGQLTEEKAWQHPLGHVLTKSIGQDSPVEPNFTEVTITPGDQLLLCSDGLWNMLADEQISTELQKIDDPAYGVKILVDAANEAGGRDNISVIIIKYSPLG